MRLYLSLCWLFFFGSKNDGNENYGDIDTNDKDNETKITVMIMIIMTKITVTIIAIVTMITEMIITLIIKI